MMGRGSMRRTLISGLLLSLGVWAADQLWGRGAPRAATAAQSAKPATAARTTAPSPSASAQSKQVIPLAMRLLPPTYASLAERLSGVGRDPFASSPLIDTLLNPPSLPSVDIPLPPPTDPADAFVAAHTLEGVVMGPHPLAAVNGQILGVGARLDGWELARVERERVTFRHLGDRRELVLSVPPPANIASSPSEQP